MSDRCSATIQPRPRKGEGAMTLLIRKSPGYWVVFGRFKTRRAANKAWAARVQGRGITAWSEIVTDRRAQEMLSPQYRIV